MERRCNAYYINSKESKKLFNFSSNFHDSIIQYLFFDKFGYISICLSNVQIDIEFAPNHFSEENLFHFLLVGVELEDSWGELEEIKNSLLINYSIEGRLFKIETGDGLLSGSFDNSRSILVLDGSNLLSELIKK